MSRLTLPPRNTSVLSPDGTMSRYWYTWLQDLLAKLAQALPPTATTATAAVTADPWTTQLCDPSGGGFTVTLPQITPARGAMEVAIAEVGNSANALTIVPNVPASETIRGNPNLVSSVALATVRLRADPKALNWVYA